MLKEEIDFPESLGEDVILVDEVSEKFEEKLEKKEIPENVVFLVDGERFVFSSVGNDPAFSGVKLPETAAMVRAIFEKFGTEIPSEKKEMIIFLQRHRAAEFDKINAEQNVGLKFDEMCDALKIKIFNQINYYSPIEEQINWLAQN
ncbi:hypothetical protein HN954_04925 [bacterium]|jgi:hypothetical protein|nr:hypothetical protein [bacterium]MBT6831815.1 hypothetical protein [bacterium]MBT6996738.1 hypothetical protein [bacterium]MBT7772186.1 hypothetical protein [bacterium]